MTCNGGSDVTYRWLQNGAVVAVGPTYTISSSRVGHSGTYQCQTSRGHSLEFQLEVSRGPVILQAPVFVYRGTDINLRCHSRPEYPVHWTTIYKYNNGILGPVTDRDAVVLYGNTDVSGRYGCERRLSRDVTYTDEVSLHVRDLFTKPNITAMLRPMTEGDTVTLTCDTRLSPLRPGTQLQFAFYTDGRKVQEFGSSNHYGVQSAQLEDSGNYSCDVRTPTNSVMKGSEGLDMQIQGTSSEATSWTTYTILIIVFTLLFLITIVVIVVVIKHRRKPSPTSTSRRPTMDPPEAESSRDLSREGDACCAQVNRKQKKPAANSTADEQLPHPEPLTMRSFKETKEGGEGMSQFIKMVFFAVNRHRCSHPKRHLEEPVEAVEMDVGREWNRHVTGVFDLRVPA
ncbi:PREDICTED: high affinity immunoglobulin gamma Fc receptor I-like [Nanorana parkeri]|uniref:high affinity immunoglobulin gamma Fc receptor I-like n=1 Tax=Nanorana parkeri TaxID=125878 RepID=UPI000854BAFA|nr:PREDICTED: high affinity immunoglobulin gamma Fc receptor I-like [Nanorana parkeri]